MTTVLNWFSMGGYASYVWPVYGMLTAVFVINIIALRRARLQTQKKLQAWFKRS
jgi:heme exporter protein CcmD